MADFKEIAVRVGADIEPLKKGFKTAGQKTKDFAKQIGKTAKTMGVLTAAVSIASFAIGVKLVNDSLDAIDAQAKLARQVGTTSASMAVLTRASELSGIEVKTLATGARTLTIRLSEAAAGSGEAVGALKSLKLTVSDLEDMTLDEKIGAINKALKDNVPAAERAAIAADLFGQKAGLAIATIDPATMARAADEVERFGLAISEVDASKVESANDALSAIKLISQGAVQELTVQLAPALQAVAEEITGVGSEAGNMKKAISGAVSSALDGFADVLEGAAGLIGFVENNPDTAKFGVLGFLIFGKKGLLIGAVVGAVFDDVRAKMVEMGLAAPKAINPIIQQIEMMESRLDTVQALMDTMVFFGREGGESYQDLINKGTILQLNIQELKSTIEEGSPAQMELNALLAEGADNGFSLAAAMQAAADAIRETKKASEEIAATPVDPRLERTKDIDPTQSPEVLAAKTTQDLITTFQRKGISDRVRDHQNSLDNMAAAQSIFDRQSVSAISGALGDISSLMSSENKKQFKIGKAAAKGQAIIDTIASAQAAFKSLAGIPIVGPGLGIAAAGAATVAGLARVSAINSTQFGGGGGVPSTAPTSSSSSSSANSAGQQGAGGGGGQSLALEGFDPTLLYTGDQLRGLIDAINEQSSDGKAVLIS